MSDTLLTAIIGAVPSIVAAFLGYGNRQRSQVIIEKANEIHTLTNSSMTAVKDQLAAANLKIEALEHTLAELQGKKP